MGECKFDNGGYFIVDGKEKTIIPQEKFSDNMIYVETHKKDDIYLHSAKIHSVSEDPSKPIRYTSIHIVAPSSKYSNRQIVVDVPNVRKPVPFFILMRALGIVSDKSIIEFCLLDLKKNENMIDLFIPSVHDANRFFTQKTAIEYIASFTKRQTTTGVLDILMQYFLPHVGELNFIDKAYFVGYMVYKLLRVYTKQENPTDRDSFNFKRVDLSGNLLYDLFREYYLIQNRNIYQTIDKEYFYHEGKYKYEDFTDLISFNIKDIFKERTIEIGFKKAFKGNWGSSSNTKRLGIVQDLNRLSWNSYISHLRKINLDLGGGLKMIAPRLLNSSQWGIIDPVDTPDGGNIGTHKHLSIGSFITSGFSAFPMIKWLKNNFPIKIVQECTPKMLGTFTKIFINGIWLGIIDNPIEHVEKMKLYKRNGIIPVYTSLTFNIESNTIFIFTDSGRIMRPIFYVDKSKKISYDSEKIINILTNGNFTWEQVISGFLDKKVDFNAKSGKIYDIENLYDIKNAETEENVEKFLFENKAIVDYIDTSEEENSLIAFNVEQLSKNKLFTHLEIEPSLIFGVLGNLIPFPECNQLPRDLFSCGQSKQAVSVYNSNYNSRIDKMGVILNYGQIPLVKTKYLNYFNKEQLPYGVNTIVAIMSYSGYNVEDAILINEGSINRGLFRTTYYTSYQSYEESSKVSGENMNSSFSDIRNKDVLRIKKGFDYSYLDEYGLIKENTPVDDQTILVGKIISNTLNPGVYTDDSVTPKKGQLGFIDKSFLTEGEEGFRIAKIRIREERIPALGDKMASRHGQKGTLGLIIPEENMPFTHDGIRPDLIINPHALPSRMTLGQLIECLTGKVACIYGGFGDATAFSYNGPNTKIYGKLLTEVGYHSSGNQLLYNGMTGEQLQSEIFIGPTYYMRLKHMVKDKINYRARGPKTALTRQSVHGRAAGGGLRIGEMERDGIIGHGMSKFLNESFLERGDLYYMAICNKTGCIAVYNKALNLFLSPSIDGPLKYELGLNNNINLNSISRHGRSFSILKIPYSLKLIIQELQVLGIQLRIITDKNVEQLMNMSYSKNINKLLKIDEPIETLIPKYNKIIEQKVNKSKNEKNEENRKKNKLSQDADEKKNILPESLEDNVSPPFPEVSPPFLDVSPPFPEVSPPFPEVSPQFLDVSPPFPEVSPPFPDVSPPFPEVSPPFPEVNFAYVPDNVSEAYVPKNVPSNLPYNVNEKTMKKFNELSEKDQKMLLRFMEKEKGKIYAKTPANEENNILNTIEEEKNEEEKESEDIKQINI